MAQLIHGTTIANHIAIHAGNLADHNIATTTYVTTQINNLIDGAPGALDTLNELAAALGDNANFATGVTDSIAARLPLAGGTMTGKILTVSTGTGTYETAMEIRETGYASTSQSAWGYSPAMTFHWGGRHAKRFGMRADGLFAIDDEPLALRSWVTGQGYLTGESDTLASVTARGNTTNGSITVQGGQGAAETTDGFGLEIMGNYTNGQYNHRLAKFDKGGGVPLYVQLTTGAANVWTNSARFGTYTGNGYEFEVYGAAKVNGDFASTGQINAAGGNSSQWNTAFGWGNHASANYLVKGTQITSDASWTTATRFGSVGDISQDAGNHALSVRSEDGNDAFMSFHIGSDYAVHFGLERSTNRMHVGGWSDGRNRYQIWDSRDFTSTNISNWNTAYGWGNHAGLYAAASHNHDDRYYTEAESDARYLYYRGYSTSGDFQTLQSSERTIRFDQVGATENWSNAPGGYTYGGVLSMRGENFGFQLWGSHTGDFFYKTQWNNDQHSGWRQVITSMNIGSQSVAYANQVGINYNNNSDANYQLLWGSGNSVYGTSEVYVNPSNDHIYASGFYANSDIYLGVRGVWLSSWLNQSVQTGASPTFNNVFANGIVGNNSSQTRDKLRVWDSSEYTIGFKNGYSFGHIGSGEYAMSFQMNNNSSRGFWWGDTAHSDAQGAAALTTDGRMNIARSLSIGEGESATEPNSTPLYVKGSTDGADVFAVDGVNGRLFTVTDSLVDSIYSVNTIAGLPVFEVFANSTVVIGKYGLSTTFSNDGSITTPGSLTTGGTITTPSHGNSSQWNTAFNKRPTGISFSGGSTKTLTLTHGDGTTIQASFNDIDTDTNSDGQTLSISGSTLTISGGNSVTIPSGGISQDAADGRYLLLSGGTLTGDLLSTHPYYPGYNNGGVGSQGSYYLYGDTSNAGIRTNGSFLANSDIYLGTRGTWLSSWLNQAVLTTSDPTFNSTYFANSNLRLYQGSGTALHIQTAYGNVQIGPQNSDWMHFETDRPNFYFGRAVYVAGAVYRYGGAQHVEADGGNWNIAVPRLYASGNKEHYLGESSGWDGAGFGSLTNLHFQGHPQFWIGAGNAYWWGGTIATEHDLLITTMPGYSSTAYYRGITFAVDNSANGNNGGSRLGRWQTYGTGWDTARLQVDASLSVGYGNRLQGSAYDEAKYPLDRGVWAHGRDNDGYGGDRIRSKLFSPTANGGGPWGSFASLEVSSFYDGNSDIPALFRMHQWGSGAVEFWKPQGRTLFIRESPGGGGSWFDTLQVSGALTVTGAISASNFSGTHSGSSSGTNTGDQTNISGNAATATSAATVTGSSTVNGYLTLATNWGVSPYTSALTIIGVHPSMTFRGSNGDTHYLIHMDSAGDIQYYFGPGYTTNDWTRRYEFAKGGNFSVLTGNISASGTVTGSNLSGTNTGDQTNISGNAATATNADTVDGKHGTNNAGNLAVYESNGYLYIPSWMNVNSGGGIFSGTNNAHLRPNTGSYGAWEMIGSKNGWSGIFFNDSGDYLMANNDEVGHYQNGIGWKFRWHRGEMYISSGTTGGGTERTVIHSGNVGSQSVNYAASSGSVAWGNISGRPDWMTSASLIASHSNANSQVNSGFYENAGGGSNWPSQTWYNSINVRHSNQGNYHGFQVAMSYYDNLLWFRSYQGNGTFQSWVHAISSANIGSQSVNYATTSGTASRANRANGNFYIDDNYGNTVVGVYESTRLQGVWAMGDAYKLSADGTSAANHYGIAWSHPNHGGEAANLTDHGVLIQTAGRTRTAISSTIWCIGDIIAFSDARVKANVEVIDNPLERLSKVRGVTFTRTDLEDPTKRYTGVIAQEMREALPEAVSENSNGELSVSYGNTVSLLIESIKAQQAQIEELKLEVKKLKGE